MQTVAMIIQYDGSYYHGWQRQSNHISIQEVIEKQLSKLLKTEITIDGSGRTDAGVHALGQCASFKADINMPIDNLKCVLNRVLPSSIGITQLSIVDDSFHARYNAIGKKYIYKIYTQKDKNPFKENYYCHYPYALDIDEMKCAMDKFIGTHDFTSFMATGSKKTNAVRTIYTFELEVSGDELIFTIHGDGFLYNMVRIIMGTLLHVGAGKISSYDIDEIINSKKRSSANYTAPANGLYLSEVFYNKAPIVY